MHNILKHILLFSILLFVPSMVFADGSSSIYKLVIEDDANLLTEEEENSLEDVMTPLTKYGNIIFKSIDTNSTTTYSYVSNYYHNTYGTTSGTVFIIDMDNREIYIFSEGSNYNSITTSKANTITDNIYTYASDSDYYSCAYEAFSEINTVLEGGKIAEPMKYISNAIVSLISASFIGFLIAFFGYKIKKSSNSEIVNNSNHSMRVNAITGRKTGMHSVYNPPTSDSGGSSGGGGGGGSSGGGGGHSF